MSTNLFVGNLSFDVNDAHLAQVFARAGTVTFAHVIADKFSGQSRGYGFVEMSTEAEAAQAITLLHGQDVQGWALTVNEARPREERSGGRDATERRGRSYAGGYSDDRRRPGGRSRW